MPQTVFDVGDLITSRLNLGVTPDGTTAAAVVVKRPDGVVITGLNTSAWAGMEKTVQWWATDDGTASGTKLAAAVVSSRVGTVLPESMYGLARATVALRAAASILRAFARNRDDREAAGLLDERADATLVQLTDAADVAGTATPAGPLPVGYFPEPVAWGDLNL
jgi:hypothetical protein